jgi:hypothetical protein
MGWDQAGEPQNFEDVRLGGYQQDPPAFIFRSLRSEQQNLQPCTAHVLEARTVHAQVARVARNQILKRQPVNCRSHSIKATDDVVAGGSHAATMKLVLLGERSRDVPEWMNLTIKICRCGSDDDRSESATLYGKQRVVIRQRPQAWQNRPTQGQARGIPDHT